MKKLVSCYKGKAIGGTLGMPFEGYTNTNSIEFYKTLPDKMHGNDDLDLQVVWLETLLRNGFPINGYHLSAAWRHLNFGPDEYGVALHNFKNKIFAPLSGA
jgi:ADP-ribosylation/crystallin J1